MRKLKLIAFLFAAVLLGPQVLHAQCTTQPFVTSPGSNATTTDGNDGPNYGYYEWSEAAQAYLLAEQGWQYFAEEEIFSQGDVTVPLSEFPRNNDPGGGGGGNPPTHPKSTGPRFTASDACKTVNFPTMTVSASRPPSGSGSLIIYRPSPYVFATRGEGFGRSGQAGVKQASKSLTCANSSDDDRQFEALKVLKAVPRVGIWLIRYAPGNYQLWSVTVPSFSDKGLQPVGTCVSNS